MLQLRRKTVPFPLGSGVYFECVEYHDEAGGAAGEGLDLGDELVAEVEVGVHVAVCEGVFEELLAW